MALPSDYLAWLRTIDCAKELIFDSVIFRVYSDEELVERGAAASDYLAAKVFVRGVDSISAESMDIDAADRTWPLTAEDARSFVTIGDSNGNYLFTHPGDNFSCWTVVGSKKSAFVFRLADDLATIIREAEYYQRAT